MESVKLWYIGTYGGEAQARPCSPAEFDIIHAHEGQLFVKAEDFDRVTAEREALQLLLNNLDDLDDQLTSLEHRRYAEQQARESAERRVEDLGLELEGFAYRLEVMTSDRDEILRKLEVLRVFAEQMARQEGEPYFARLAEAALNPTAEAVSHE